MAETTLVADRGGELRMEAADKQERYATIRAQAEAVLAGERDLLTAMTTLVCLLHNAFPYFYWTGFYRRTGPRTLRVGPYQGTMGCLEIDFDRGVCGASAREARSVVVDDVRDFPGHVACDAASVSEIVVPVPNADGEVIAVLDVDSTLPAAFDDVDRRELEAMVALLRTCEPLPVVSTA